MIQIPEHTQPQLLCFGLRWCIVEKQVCLHGDVDKAMEVLRLVKGRDTHCNPDHLVINANESIKAFWMCVCVKPQTWWEETLMMMIIFHYWLEIQMTLHRLQFVPVWSGIHNDHHMVRCGATQSSSSCHKWCCSSTGTFSEELNSSGPK